jgi:hypothetical protein
MQLRVWKCGEGRYFERGGPPNYTLCVLALALCADANDIVKHARVAKETAQHGCRPDPCATSLAGTRDASRINASF